MLKQNGILELSPEEAEILINDIEATGWIIYRLPSGISSKEEFFDAIRNSIPLDPELHSNKSWDALADSLWGGLDGLKENKIAILWPNSSIPWVDSQEEFYIAENILFDVSESLSTEGDTDRNVKKLLILKTN